MIYKKLGDFISEIDIRNVEEKTDGILGVSVSKVFIPTIANTIGTDFSKYKVIKRNEFAYIPDTSRRGDKIGIALLNQQEEALVSQAYTVFKTSDDLLPEYLMLWFQRPEFDRYARYHSIGSAREVFSWDDMCNVELPIPSIEDQKEIVRKYKVITDRIKVLTDINQKLEETARTLFKEFYCNKPKNVGLGDIIQECPKSKVQVGTARQCNGGLYPFFTSGAEILVYDQFLTDGRKILLNTGGRADIKFHVGKAAYSTDTWCIKAKDNLTDYLFLVLCDMKAAIDDEYFNGSALRHLQKPKFKTIKIYKPTDTELENLNKVFIPVFNIVAKNNEEIQKLTELKDVLLPKLMTGDIN